MNKIYRAFVISITFLTRIPWPLNFEFNNKDFKNGICFYPIIGIIIGIFLCLPVLIIKYINLKIQFINIPEYITAFIVILMYLKIVGGLHIDGISDVCDGIFSARKRERILEIIKDSHIGAFGSVSLIIYFLGYYLGIYKVIKGQNIFLINEEISPFIFIIMATFIGRCAGIFIAGLYDYAKNEGSAKILTDTIRLKHSIITIIGVILLFSIISIGATIVAIVTFVSITLITKKIDKILGGIVGDVIGLSIEVAQVIFLIML